jgi:uncharacterized protein YdaU (DUF1376 family)
MERKGTVEPIVRNYWLRRKIQKWRRKRRREKIATTRAQLGRPSALDGRSFPDKTQNHCHNRLIGPK